MTLRLATLLSRKRQISTDDWQKGAAAKQQDPFWVVKEQEVEVGTAY
jgi:hypothetical protein